MDYNFATTGVNDPIDLRIRHLKHQLMQDLEYNNVTERYSLTDIDQYSYVDSSNEPITPISEHDKRKFEDRYKQPEIKSTTTEKYVASSESITDTEIPFKIHHKTHSKRKSSHRTAKKPKLDIFYRRVGFDNTKDRTKPQKWTHCLDLLSPFLNGYLFNITKSRKKVYSTDTNIRRLAYLLMLNMTDATTEEIRAIMYEISNLPIRLYQWDTSAVKAIIRAIAGGSSHDFKGLKDGLKLLFHSWKLNTSNLTRLLSQSRVFRPPCIQITDYGGSTLPQKIVRYTKPGQNDDKDKRNTYPTKDEDC